MNTQELQRRMDGALKTSIMNSAASALAAPAPAYSM